MNENELKQLLDFIRGEGVWIAFGQGITTYPDEPDEKHNACLELERRGLIYRRSETDTYIIWKPTLRQP